MPAKLSEQSSSKNFIMFRIPILQRYLLSGFVSALLLALPIWHVYAESPRITFSCSLAPHSSTYMKLERLYRAAFKALDYEFSMVHRPLQRSLQDANSGLSDGDCASDENHLAMAPESQLLRVSVPIASIELQVWSKDPLIKLASITELNNANYRMGYIQGTAVIKTILTEDRMKDAYPFADVYTGINVLLADRIDILVAPEVAIKNALVTLDSGKPLYHSGTVYRQTDYAFLNPKHQKLIPALARELKKRISPEGIVLE